MIIDRRHFLKSVAAAGIALPIATQFSVAQDTDSVLKIGLSDYPVSMRPAQRTVGYATLCCWSLIHAGLIRYSADGKLVGELAESWALEPDSSWTFKLREAKFSNGAPITAADLRYSIERMSSDELAFGDRALFKAITSVEVVDDRTVRVRTSTPNATVPALFAMPAFFVLAANSDSAQNEPGIGAGPYVLDTFERGVGLTYLPNKHYFRGAPRFSDVKVTVYNDENLRVAALLAGDVDLIDYVPWASMATLEQTPTVALKQENEGGYMALCFSGKGPFADVRLRQAVAFGIRRDEIVQGVFYGRGAVMTGLPRPKAGGLYQEDQAKYWSYNPDKSRQLMKDAGVADGFSCSLLATSTYGFWRDTAVLVAGHLGELGIKIDLLLPDWATNTAMINRGEGDIALTGGGLLTLDPSGLSSTLDPSLSVGRRSHDFQIPGLTDLLIKGGEEFDTEKRRDIYRQADQLALDGATYVGLAYRATGFGLSGRLKGFQMLPSLISPSSYLNLGGLSLT